MRTRDAALYYLREKGYRKGRKGSRHEIWYKDEDPTKTVVIPADGSMPRDFLIRFLKELLEQEGA